MNVFENFYLIWINFIIIRKKINYWNKIVIIWLNNWKFIELFNIIIVFKYNLNLIFEKNYVKLSKYFIIILVI